MDFTYPVILTPDPEDGGFVVTFPDIPEAITEGDTEAAALDEAQGALEAALEYRVREGLDIPAPSAPAQGQPVVGAPVRIALKAALHLAMKEAHVNKSELARRMDLDEKEARRILDLKHATRVPTIERALRVLGKQVEVHVR